MFSNEEEELATLAKTINSLKQTEKASTLELKRSDDVTLKINTELKHLEEQLYKE